MDVPVRLPAPPAAPGLDLGAARAIAEDAVRAGELPCAVLGVADAAGIRGMHAVNGRGRPVGIDSIFFLASVTKAIVATAVMQYVDEGRLDLRAPLARYLPGFEGRGRERVAAWHILTHTSGLPDMHIETLRHERPDYERLLDFALSSVPAWEPGSRYAYNSAAWLLLSETMARLSSRPFAEALHTRLTEPLGMIDTTFDARPLRSRVVSMNDFSVQGRITEEVLLRFLARARLPGGGMFGTLPDLLRLGRALLPRAEPDGSPGPRALSQAIIDEMARYQTAGIFEILEDGSRRQVYQAIGWRKPGPAWPDRPAAIMHGGISGTRLWVDPEAGLTFALLTNRWQAPEERVIAVLEAVYEAWPPARAAAS
jgi:CubicO group peptidase (beta-lactamase class C family)